MRQRVSEGIDRLVAQVNTVAQPAMPVPEARQTGPSPKGYVQIGGDFGDPWASGGTWYSAEDGMIIHHDELSDEEWNGVPEESSSLDKMLTPVDYQNIVKSLSAEKDEAWEAVESTAREGHASVFNAARKFTYYRTTEEPNEVIEADWAGDIDQLKQETDDGEELWAGLSPAMKLAELANRLGWHEFDHYPEQATKAELSVILGINL